MLGYSDSVIQQTNDGGYILTATKSYSYSDQGVDVWLIKTDLAGNEMWNKTFGESNNDYAISVQQTREGGYVIAGNSYSLDSARGEAWLIKNRFSW